MTATFTDKQLAQLKRHFDVMMRVGPAHVILVDCTPLESVVSDGSLKWYRVTAYHTSDPYKTYRMDVGVSSDRRRHVYTVRHWDN